MKEPTLRGFLEWKEFDWTKGRIIYYPTTGYSPGWSYGNEIGYPREIDRNHPILDETFDAGFGSPQCPRFVAYDEEFVYFPSQYDGATTIDKAARDPQYYLDHPKVESPYPGD